MEEENVFTGKIIGIIVSVIVLCAVLVPITQGLSEDDGGNGGEGSGGSGGIFLQDFVEGSRISVTQDADKVTITRDGESVAELIKGNTPWIVPFVTYGNWDMTEAYPEYGFECISWDTGSDGNMTLRIADVDLSGTENYNSYGATIDGYSLEITSNSNSKLHLDIMDGETIVSSSDYSSCNHLISSEGSLYYGKSPTVTGNPEVVSPLYRSVGLSGGGSREISYVAVGNLSSLGSASLYPDGNESTAYTINGVEYKYSTHTAEWELEQIGENTHIKSVTIDSTYVAKSDPSATQSYQDVFDWFIVPTESVIDTGGSSNGGSSDNTTFDTILSIIPVFVAIAIILATVGLLYTVKNEP